MKPISLFLLFCIIALAVSTSTTTTKKTLSSPAQASQKSSTEKTIVEGLKKSEKQLVDQEIPSYSALDVTSITITGGSGGAPTLSFSNGNSGVSIDLESDGSLSINDAEDSEIASIDQNGDLTVSGNLQAVSLEFNGPLVYAGQPQWRQFINENFWSPPSGWSLDEVTLCGGAYLLGGYCVLSRGELQKEYDGLPAHTQLKVEGVFHYIDSWNGESAFLQLNTGSKGENAYVWMDRYDSTAAVSPVNICGSPIGEGRFGVPFSVVVPHTSNSVTVTFGTTADQDPCDQSWGISNLAINVM